MLSATTAGPNSPAQLRARELRFHTAGTALHRILHEAPFLARCSDDKTATRIRPRDYAIRYPYMQINRPGFVSWLIFDLDHANAAIWQDAGLPAPNLIVRNRNSGHAHLYYAITPVCTSEQARAKPIAYMRATYEAMAARLNADPDYNSGPVAKTPGHPWWQTTELHAHVYELGELSDCVDMAASNRWSRGPQLANVQHSRHCILFEHLRHFAYSIVNREREQGTFASFTRQLEAQAHNLNSFRKLGFAADLAWSSLKATVKSIARWTWDKYTGSGRCHRGVMQLNADLPLAERQKLAAAHTHEQRRATTASRIRLACRQLIDAGVRITLTAIAERVGLSRQAVAEYKDTIEQAKTPTTIHPLEQAANAQPSVNYAAHQVTATPVGEGVLTATGLESAKPEIHPQPDSVGSKLRPLCPDLVQLNLIEHPG